MRKLLTSGLGVAAGLLVIAAAGEAQSRVQSSVLVIGDGDAKACERAAVRGQSKPVHEEACTRALESEPLNVHDRAGTYVNRGVIKMRRAEWEAARADFEEATRVMPSMGEAYVNRGTTLIGLGRFQDGLSEIDRGLALGVRQPEKAHFNRAVAYEGLNDMKSAYFAYRQALELKPEWSLPRQELGRFKVSRR